MNRYAFVIVAEHPGDPDAAWESIAAEFSPPAAEPDPVDGRVLYVGAPWDVPADIPGDDFATDVIQMTIGTRGGVNLTPAD